MGIQLANGTRLEEYAGTPEANVTATVGSLCLDYTNGRVYRKATGSGNTGWVPVQPSQAPTFTISASPLVVSTGTSRWYNDTGLSLTLIAVRLWAGTAPTGASLIVDVNKNGTTMFSSGKPTLTATNQTSKTTGPSTTNLDDGDYLTVDVDQIGSTLAGGGPLLVTPIFV